MTITRGKIHKYIGITIDYSFTGKVILSMVSYIGKILNYIPKDMRGGSATLDAHHFLILREMQPNYPEPTKIFFIIL